MTRMRSTGQDAANILNTVQEAYVRFNSEFRCTFVNRAAEQLLGKSQDELLGKVLWELCPPPFGTPFEQHYRQAMAARVEVTFDHYYDAWQRWYAIAVTPDSADGIVVHFADITGQKRVEESLRKSHDLLLKAEKIARIGSFEWEVETGSVTWSPELYRQYGLDTKPGTEPSFEVAMAMIHPEDRDSVKKRVEEMLQTGAFPPYEYRLLLPNGVLRHARATAKVVRTRGDAPLVVCGIVQDITDFKRAEEALRQSERRLRLAQDAAKSGTWEWDLRSNQNFWSEELFALFGLAPHSCVPSYEAWLQAIHPDDRAMVAATVNEAASRGLEVNVEFRVNPSTAPERWLMGRGQPQRDEDGCVERYLGIAVDITDHKRAEEAVRKSEERFQLSMEATSDGLWDWNTQTDEAYFSPGFYRMLGYPVGAFPGKGAAWMDLIHPDDREHAARVNTDCVEGRSEPLEVEYRMRAMNGEWRWILSRGKCIARDAQGRALRLVGTHVDITERKQAEEALRISERRLREAQEVGHTGYLDWDIVTNEIVWSDGTCRMYGFEPGSCAPTLALTVGLVPAEDRERVERRLAMALDGTSDYDVEHRVARPDGQVIHVHARGKVTRGAGGTPLRMLGTVVDITERKRNEEEKERLQLQLAHAQKLESIGRLAGGIAHDFNNLLTVINGYAAFLSQQLDVRDPLRGYALEIGEAGQRAARLTSQLLAFSRKQAIRPEVINLNAVIADTEGMLQRLIGEDLELVSRLAPHLGHVMADRDQIHQVIMNLAVNARDAMPNGGKLEIATADVELDETAAATHPDAAPGRYVQLTVADTGTGMTEEVRRNIFEPFFTTKEQGKGTGLGLAMVYGIVRQNGGWIEVESELGRGSTFRIHLPRIDVGVTAGEAKPAPENASHRDETVLIVEDQEAVRGLVKRILAAHGYHVLEAADGAEAHAVSRAHAGEIDLLLTDLVMPGMDGYLLSEQLRKMRPNLRVVMMSGFAEDRIAHRGALARGVAYIQKPFGPDELAAKIREILDVRVCS